MKNIQRFLLVALAALLLTTTGFAQRDPNGGPGTGSGNPKDTIHHPKDTIRNPKDTIHHPKQKAPCRVLQIDSCKKLFLSSIPAVDAQAIELNLAEMDRLMNELNALKAQINIARKAKDTAQMRILREQLKVLQSKMHAAGKTLKELLRKYHVEFRAASDNCCGNRKPPAGGKRDIDPINKDAFKMSPIMPNPVPNGTPTAQFNYALAGDANVFITISDPMGNVIKKIDLGLVTAGEHNVVLDLAGLEPGTYLVRVQVGNAVQTQKLVITK